MAAICLTAAPVVLAPAEFRRRHSHQRRAAAAGWRAQPLAVSGMPDLGVERRGGRSSASVVVAPPPRADCGVQGEQVGDKWHFVPRDWLRPLTPLIAAGCRSAGILV